MIRNKRKKIKTKRFSMLCQEPFVYLVPMLYRIEGAIQYIKEIYYIHGVTHVSGRPDSNWRPSPWQGDVLPTELLPRLPPSYEGHSKTCVFSWLRDPDLNREPSGYGPDELPLLYPAIYFLTLVRLVVYRDTADYSRLPRAGERNRTVVTSLENWGNNHYTTPALSASLTLRL